MLDWTVITHSYMYSIQFGQYLHQPKKLIVSLKCGNIQQSLTITDWHAILFKYEILFVHLHCIYIIFSLNVLFFLFYNTFDLLVNLNPMPFK